MRNACEMVKIKPKSRIPRSPPGLPVAVLERATGVVMMVGGGRVWVMGGFGCFVVLCLQGVVGTQMNRKKDVDACKQRQY